MFPNPLQQVGINQQGAYRKIIWLGIFQCSTRRNLVSPGLCPRLPGRFIDKPVLKAKEILTWLVWESDQGNCCCPSCNERSGSHRLVARGRSRSTCFYFVYFLYLFYFYLQSPSLPFLAHLLHFFLIDDPNCLLPATFVSWPLSVPPLVWYIATCLCNRQCAMIVHISGR